NVMQLEGQARATLRAIAEQLRQIGRLKNWVAGGISATHHTAARIDGSGNQIRRAICWNDQTLAKYHAKGQERLGGPDGVKKLIGGPWAVPSTPGHLVKDEETLSEEAWKATAFILPHGPLAAGYLTGCFDSTSISSAASTGIMDLRTNEWCKDMLNCLEKPEHREMVWRTLPVILEDMNEPIGPLDLGYIDAGLGGKLSGEDLYARATAIFPTLDDQPGGLVGGDCAAAGQGA